MANDDGDDLARDGISDRDLENSDQNNHYEGNNSLPQENDGLLGGIAPSSKSTPQTICQWGHIMSPDWKVCPHCGQPATTNSIRNVSSNMPSGTGKQPIIKHLYRRWIILGVVFCILLLGTLILTLNAASSKSATSTTTTAPTHTLLVDVYVYYATDNYRPSSIGSPCNGGVSATSAYPGAQIKVIDPLSGNTVGVGILGGGTAISGVTNSGNSGGPPDCDFSTSITIPDLQNYEIGLFGSSQNQNTISYTHNEMTSYSWHLTLDLGYPG
ncbi:MAG: hypothetical protein HKL80_01120 [Acidimicrobiales bacterium]|nr:hypothetical protein [Acidimicrobiales bacterium]